MNTEVVEVLDVFEKANYIFTDTFHGTIFSVIKHKQVVIFPRCNNGLDFSNNNKLIDLVNKLGLEKQLYQTSSNLNEVCDNKIDYEKIDLIRKSERINTIEYLKKYCSN